MCVFMAGVAELTFLLICIMMYKHRLDCYILCKILHIGNNRGSIKFFFKNPTLCGLNVF